MADTEQFEYEAVTHDLRAEVERLKDLVDNNAAYRQECIESMDRKQDEIERLEANIKELTDHGVARDRTYNLLTTALTSYKAKVERLEAKVEEQRCLLERACDLGERACAAAIRSAAKEHAESRDALGNAVCTGGNAFSRAEAAAKEQADEK